jgi:hypothetical protein
MAPEFAERDAALRNHAAFDAIELWFEHDLYDQLQLVQILATLADLGRAERVTLVQADDFLGAQSADTILRFADNARPIVRADLDLGRFAWEALAAPTPEPVAALATSLDARLPFLRPALRRFLQELPAPGNGLGRTEVAILDGIAHGSTSPPRLFHTALLEEEAAFMGDWSFFHLIDDLATAEVPLVAGLPGAVQGEDDIVRFRAATLELTMAGDDVLAGEEDHVALSGLDRWWAGTRLQGRDVWRYDRLSGELVAPATQGG